MKQSPASNHLQECNCSKDFDYFDILASEANKFRVLIKESLMIKFEQHQLNKIIKSFPLDLFDWDICWSNFTLHKHVAMEILKLMKGVFE